MTCMNLCLSWLTWSSNLYNYQENKHKTEFVVTVSYIEIYMEELRDLLDVDTSSKDMFVREDDKGNTGIMTYLCVWVSLCLSALCVRLSLCGLPFAEIKCNWFHTLLLYLHAELYKPIAAIVCLFQTSPPQKTTPIVLIDESWSIVEDWGFHVLQGKVT